MGIRKILSIGVMVAGVFSLAGPMAEAQSVRRTSAVIVLGSTSAPLGWMQFCRENPVDCRARSAEARDATLSGNAFAEMVRINVAVNTEIEQVTDDENFGVAEYWTYPVAGKGDCEDLVLEKKRRLIALGWPREALLITVVRDLKGEGHAVLTVKTDRGDYILDNHTDEVKLWSETGYRFIKRQAQTDPNQWVLLQGDAPAVPQVASAAQR